MDTEGGDRKEGIPFLPFFFCLVPRWGNSVTFHSSPLEEEACKVLNGRKRPLLEMAGKGTVVVT